MSALTEILNMSHPYKIRSLNAMRHEIVFARLGEWPELRVEILGPRDKADREAEKRCVRVARAAARMNAESSATKIAVAAEIVGRAQSVAVAEQIRVQREELAARMGTDTRETGTSFDPATGVQSFGVPVGRFE